MEMTGSSQNTASFPHSHSFGDDLGFPSSPSSFNFNFDEKCYLHARYFLLPTCQFAQTENTTGFRVRVRTTGFGFVSGHDFSRAVNEWG